MERKDLIIVNSMKILHSQDSFKITRAKQKEMKC